MKTIEMLMTSEAAADDTSLHAYNSANASCSSVLLFFLAFTVYLSGDNALSYIKV